MRSSRAALSMFETKVTEAGSTCPYVSDEWGHSLPSSGCLWKKFERGGTNNAPRGGVHGVRLFLWALFCDVLWTVSGDELNSATSLWLSVTISFLHSLATSSNCVLSEYTKTNRNSCVPHRSTCFCVWSACLNLKFVDVEDFLGLNCSPFAGYSTKRDHLAPRLSAELHWDLKLAAMNMKCRRWHPCGRGHERPWEALFQTSPFFMVFYACFRHDLSNCRSCIQSLRQCGTAQYSQTMWQYDNALKMLQFGAPFAKSDAEFGNISATQARGHTPRRRANHTHIYIYVLCIYIYNT